MRASIGGGFGPVNAPERSVENAEPPVMARPAPRCSIQSMTTPIEVAQSFKAALGKGDLAAARKLMHDDMSFKGPLDAFDKPEPYLEALKKLGAIVDRVEVKKLFADGDDVCMLYDMVTKTPAGTAFISEWLTVRDGRIAKIRTVFDARPFAAMFGK
jgi:ketosteroid isomerase-like protein